MDDPEDEILLGDTVRIVCTSQIGSHGTSKVVTGAVVDFADDSVVAAEADESEVVVSLSANSWTPAITPPLRSSPTRTR